MKYQTVILEKEGGIATITLNRPDRLNAVDSQLTLDLIDALKDVDSDEGVRVVIITGAGRGFCSGADLSSMLASGAAEAGVRQAALEPTINQVTLLIRNLKRPSIAAVNGVAAGMGFSIALACDIRIASENARFSQIFVRRGLIPDTGSTYFLPRAVGMSKACEMVFTGQIIDAREAERIGLVSRVVPHDELMKATRELATTIAKGPPITIQLAKRALYRGYAEEDLAFQHEYEMHLQGICMQTEDFKEGVSAFLEKREPIFKGR